MTVLTPATCKTSVQCLLQKVCVLRSVFRYEDNGSVNIPTASNDSDERCRSWHIAYALSYSA